MKVRREARRKQLNYLKRNIRFIEELMTKMDPDSDLVKEVRKLIIIRKIYEQQKELHSSYSRSVPQRIVSVSQPHIRPIVRGKSGTPVEFGAKITVSLIEGYCFIDHLSWENFNEGIWLKSQIENYRMRLGFYPESVHADQIYMNRENRRYCKEKGIRLSGKPLGRPVKETTENRDDMLQIRKQRYQDQIDRIAVEGSFGVAKRKYGLGLIKSKLQQTSETEIALAIFTMNLDRICSGEIRAYETRYKVNRVLSCSGEWDNFVLDGFDIIIILRFEMGVVIGHGLLR
jgi:IS5 family transposase